MVFLKKYLIQGSIVILVQNWYVIVTFSSGWRFLLILHNKRVQELHENFVSCSFWEKNLIWRYLISLGDFLLLHWVWPKLSKAAVTNASLNSQDMITFMITDGFWNSQGMIRIHD